MSSYQIGAQLFSVRNHCQNMQEMHTTLKLLKTMGYNICQLSGISKDIPAEQIKEMLDDTGLIAPSTHISFKAMEEDMGKVIREHKLLGCEYPGIGCIPGEFRENGSEGYLEFSKRLNRVAHILKDNGLQFIYHNHAFEFERHFPAGKNGLEILLENCTEDVMFELDLFWVQRGGGNPLEWIQKVKGRMDIVHFKEMNGTSTNQSEIAPIGKGNMNWAAILPACDEIGVKYAFIEQDNAIIQGSIDCMMYSMNALKKLGGTF